MEDKNLRLVFFRRLDLVTLDSELPMALPELRPWPIFPNHPEPLHPWSLTASLPLKNGAWKTTFLLGRGHFSGAMLNSGVYSQGSVVRKQTTIWPKSPFFGIKSLLAFGRLVACYRHISRVALRRSYRSWYMVVYTSIGYSPSRCFG